MLSEEQQCRLWDVEKSEGVGKGFRSDCAETSGSQGSTSGEKWPKSHYHKLLPVSIWKALASGMVDICLTERPGHEAEVTGVSVVGSEGTSTSSPLGTLACKQGICWGSLEKGSQLAELLVDHNRIAHWLRAPERKKSASWLEALVSWVGLTYGTGLNSRLQAWRMTWEAVSGMQLQSQVNRQYYWGINPIRWHRFKACICLQTAEKDKESNLGQRNVWGWKKIKLQEELKKQIWEREEPGNSWTVRIFF